MGRGTARKTCLLKFLVVDVPSAYNVILGRPTLNTFQAVISTYHMKIKFPTPGGIEKYKATLFNPEGATWTLSVEERRGAEMTLKTKPLLIRKGRRLRKKSRKQQKPLLRCNRQKNCLTSRSYQEILTKPRELALT
ncbi:UNVERIFIED_CONTAM: hypothetical protein Slati_2991200 [Sesamum latifolium]|uniref:Uncharacterized protein n=1 Tax=Sesamum latifolium TaxID=2727402 RepID=A0AAW2VEV0_9LAMI